MATESVDVTSEMFGRGVTLFRVESGLSQRDLAEKLRARGLTFDTAAISRIESGKRSVRLAEAVTLASVLGVPLEVLVSGGRESPAAAYERAQSRADQALVDLRRTFIDAAAKHLQVTGLLARHPEMLPRMHAPNVQSADDYLAYVADVRQRIEEQLRRHDPLDNGRYVVVPTDRERQDLVRLALATIETSIVTREEVQAHRGEASNPAE